MSTFAETADVDYRLSFADQGKQISVFCYYTVQVGRHNTGNRHTVDRQTSYRVADIMPVSSMYTICKCTVYGSVQVYCRYRYEYWYMYIYVYVYVCV
jgi:hypothetical protein